MTAVADATLREVRDDFVVFCDRVLREPLWPHQREAALSPAFITVIAAARRTGKTTLIEQLAIWTGFRERNVKVVILSAALESARRVTESIGRTLMTTPGLSGSVVDDFATRIRLSNGSEIISLPASQRQVRGYGKGVKLLVIDEAGIVPEEMWQAAHYVAMDEKARGSRILLAGTPWGNPDMFFRQNFAAGVAGDPDTASFHWTYKANPDLDHAYLERQRHKMSPAKYANEVLGEWSDAAGSLFPHALLDRQTVDVEIPSREALVGRAGALVGVDWGVSFDRSAACLIFRLPVADLNPDVPWLPRFLALPYVWDQGAPLSDVVGDVLGVRVPFSVLSAETNGVGAMPVQELFRGLALRPRHLRESAKNPLHTTAATKTAGYGAVLALLERGQLFLPRSPDLLRQLAGLRFEQGERGFTRIGAEDDAVHDDIADSLYLAMGVHRPSGAHRLMIQALRYADPSVAQSDVRVDAGGIPVVTAGSGIRVWQRPVLQDVFTKRDRSPTVIRPPGWARA